MRKVVCQIEDSGAVTVTFSGGHLNKRELLRTMRAMKLQYNADVRLYRISIRIKTNQAVSEEETKAKELSKIEGVKEDAERNTNQVTEQREDRGEEGRFSESNDGADGSSPVSVGEPDSASVKPKSK